MKIFILIGFLFILNLGSVKADVIIDKNFGGENKILTKRFHRETVLSKIKWAVFRELKSSGYTDLYVGADIIYDRSNYHIDINVWATGVCTVIRLCDRYQKVKLVAISSKKYNYSIKMSYLEYGKYKKTRTIKLGFYK